MSHPDRFTTRRAAGKDKPGPKYFIVDTHEEPSRDVALAADRMWADYIVDLMNAKEIEELEGEPA